MNKAYMIGNLADDAKVRRFEKGSGALTTFRIACEERYLDKQTNEWKKKKEYVGVKIWGPLGEQLASRLVSGAQVVVEGSLRTSSYDRNGEKRFVTDVDATNVIVTDGGYERRAP